MEFSIETSMHNLMVQYAVDTIQDFLRNLGMKPHMHLVEISTFSLNHVIVTPTKIMNNLIEDDKILTFSHFSLSEIRDALSQFCILKNNRLREQ